MNASISKTVSTNFVTPSSLVVLVNRPKRWTRFVRSETVLTWLISSRFCSLQCILTGCTAFESTATMFGKKWESMHRFHSIGLEATDIDALQTMKHRLLSAARLEPPKPSRWYMFDPVANNCELRTRVIVGAASKTGKSVGYQIRSWD